MYNAHLRLIDTSTASVIVEGACYRVIPETTDNAPTYDELTENDANRLKTEIMRAAKTCIQQFSSKYFNL